MSEYETIEIQIPTITKYQLERLSERSGVPVEDAINVLLAVVLLDEDLPGEMK